MEEERNVYRVLTGKPEGKRPLGRPKLGSEWILARLADWIKLAQDTDRWRALVNTVMNLRVLTPRS
jgi:hypothetical protein